MSISQAYNSLRNALAREAKNAMTHTQLLVALEAHQHRQFSVGGALRTGYFLSPQKCAEFWNQRA